jgi:hypothetical protein
MEDCKIAKQVAEWNPQGRRRRGRPVNTWKDGVRKSMQRRNLRDEECFDREFWGKKIMSLVEEICVPKEKILRLLY